MDALTLNEISADMLHAISVHLTNTELLQVYSSCRYLSYSIPLSETTLVLRLAGAYGQGIKWWRKLIISSCTNLVVYEYILSKCQTSQARSKLLHSSNDYPFRLACEFGLLEVVTYLLASEPDVDRRRQMISSENNMPVVLAAVNGHYQVLEHILLQEPDLEKRREMILSRDNRAMCGACKRGYLNTVQCILQVGLSGNLEAQKALIFSGNSIGIPVYLALCRGHLTVAKYMLSFESDASQVRRVIRGWDYYVIDEAAHYGHLHVIKYILSMESDPDHREAILNHDHYNPFRLACEHGRLEVVKFLLCRSSDIEGKRRRISTSVEWHHRYLNNPLYLALTNGHLDVVEYLVSFLKDPLEELQLNASCKYRFFCDVLHKGHLQVGMYLMSLVSDINQQREMLHIMERTTMFYAIHRSSKLLMNYILTSNTPQDLRRMVEYSSGAMLIKALYYGHLDVGTRLASLFPKDAIKSMLRYSKDYALYMSASNGHLHVVKYILSLYDTEEALEIISHEDYRILKKISGEGHGGSKADREAVLKYMVSLEPSRSKRVNMVSKVGRVSKRGKFIYNVR